MCLEYYELDPCHYFSSLVLSFDAKLKMTKIELELISRIDIYLFVEKGIREGIFYIAKRCTKKPIINTWNVMMIVNPGNVSCICTQIIYMVGQLVNIFLTVNLNV